MRKYNIIYIEHDNMRHVTKDTIEYDDTKVNVEMMTSPDTLELYIKNNNVDLIITDAFFLGEDEDHTDGKDGEYKLSEIIDTIDQSDNKRIKIAVLTRLSELLLNKHKSDLDRVDFLWEKRGMNQMNLEWWIRRIRKDSFRRFPEHQLVFALLKFINEIDDNNKIPWKREIQEMVSEYNNFTGEPDKIEAIKSPLWNIAKTINISKELSEIFEAIAESETLSIAGKPKAWGHLRHVINVFWLGYLIINSDILNIKEIYKTFPDYKECDEKTMWHIVNSAWFIASICHDIGLIGERMADIRKEISCVTKYYPIEEYNLVLSIENEKVWTDLKNGTNIIQGDIGGNKANEFSNTVDYLNKINKIDHGVLGAATVLKEFKGDQVDNRIIRAAAQAIALHNIIGRIDKKENCLTSINYDTHPLSCLLILCDQLQIWDRETGLESRFKDLPIECAELAKLEIDSEKKEIYGKIIYYPFQGPISNDNRIKLKNGITGVINNQMVGILNMIDKEILSKVQIKIEFIIDGIGKITKWP